MVILKKDTLMESDFSMCLGTLWKYELNDPDDPSDLLAKTIQVKKNYLAKIQPSKESDQSDDFFDFETIEGDVQAFKAKFENKSYNITAPSKESKARQQEAKSNSVGRKFLPNFSFRKKGDGELSQSTYTATNDNSKKGLSLPSDS